MNEHYEGEIQINIQELLTFILKSGHLSERQFAKLGSIIQSSPEMKSRVEGIYKVSKMPGQENKKSYEPLLEDLRGDIDAMTEAE